MIGFCGQTELNKVNFAMTKLCSAYASQRISMTLFRHQRALLIAYATTDQQKPFPELVLNEYSQAAEVVFESESTPVVDDLGFTEESVWQELPSVESIMPTLDRNVFLKQECKPSESPFSSFDRFYWVYLILFLLAVAIFVGTR